MESVQNNRANQSYYDPSANVCRAEASSAPPAEGSAVAAPSQSVERTLSAGAAALVEASRASGTGGARGVPASVGAGGGPGVWETPTQESSLCAERLMANAVICAAAGNLLASRLGLPSDPTGGAGAAITSACTVVGYWLEHNAPLGACSDD